MNITDKIRAEAEARGDRRRESTDAPREEAFSKLAGPAGSLALATGSAFYAVIEDNQDENGYGDYLHSHTGQTYEEARLLLASDPKCTHIDFFDGNAWHYDVSGPVLPNTAYQPRGNSTTENQ